MSTSSATDSVRSASRPQLRSLGVLINRNRHRGVTLTQVADRAEVSIGWLSEVCRGILPGGRRLSKAEYARLRQTIQDLAAEGNR